MAGGEHPCPPYWCQGSNISEGNYTTLLPRQSKLLELGDFSGPKESHPMRHVPMADMLLELKDEAEIAKKENLLIRQAALTKLLEEDNRILDESIKKIMSADENLDEEL